MLYLKETTDHFLIFKMQGDLTSNVAQMITNEINNELSQKSNFKIVILDLKELDIHHKAFQILSPLGIKLIKENKKVYLLTAKPSIKKILKQEGMDRLLNPISGFDEILEGGPKVKTVPKMDVNFLNPFVDATLHVLDVQCQCKATPLKPVLKAGDEFSCRIDIAGIIGITSSGFKGNIAICFPAEVFLLLMSKMFGEDLKEITEELQDGAAEITNMIFGNAKRVLNERGFTIEKAIPSVVRGPDIKVTTSTGNDSIILPFTIDKLTFYMEIGTEPN